MAAPRSIGIAGLLALLLLAVSALAPAAPAAADAPSRKHPAVDAFLLQHRGEVVPVIAKAAGSLDSVAADLAALGAQRVRRLPLAGAVAAWVPPAEVDRLSRGAHVAWLSLDAAMVPSGAGGDPGRPDEISNTFAASVRAPEVWNRGVTGRGVTVAVIDSGLTPGRDFRDRVAAAVDLSSATNRPTDANGHGTYVAGIVAGRSERFSGIAPGAGVLSLKVAGREGSALASDVIAALQWAVDHRDEFNIRVVNISLVSSIPDSYRRDPLSAAVEQAWFHGIVVVVSAGNFGDSAFAADHAPANDPFVITAGGFDERGTAAPGDDAPADWSSRGLTVDGYAKPEVVAPGMHIASTLARGSRFAERAADPSAGYIALSGTSAAAAIVSGTVALMLEGDPGLTPDQVKRRLAATGATLAGSDAPRIDAYAATFSTLTASANGAAQASDLIDAETGDVVGDMVLWRGVLWRGVLWRSIEGSVLWR